MTETAVNHNAKELKPSGIHCKTNSKKLGAMAKFDKDEFMRHFNLSLVERLPGLIYPGSSAIFFYSGELNLEQIAQGIAVAAKREASIIKLISNDLKPGDSAILLNPLLTGQLLILIHTETSTIPKNLVKYWPEFCRNPNYYTAFVTSNIVLNERLKFDIPGSVIVIYTSSLHEKTADLREWRLPEDEATAFTSLANQYNLPTISIGRIQSSIETIKDNEHAYRIYRKLISTISQQGHLLSVAEEILQRVISGIDPTELWLDFSRHGLSSDLYDELFYQLRNLAEHCKNISGGFFKDDPLPDVYAAALLLAKRNKDGSMVYRGQRNAEWQVIPSYFRPNPDGANPDFDKRNQRLNAFIELMMNAFPQIDENQGLAAAQHVSKEADTPTWLIDVTWDPLVALFFAGTNAKDNDIGVVDMIPLGEWKKYIASQPDLPGEVIMVEAPFVERIQRQHGLFLNAPRADLYERFVPYRLWFRQKAGLEFFDHSINPPISEDWLLPEEPLLSQLIVKLENVWENSMPTVMPESDPTIPLVAEDLLRTLSSREGVAELNSFHQFVLRIVCELYTKTEEWIIEDDPSKYSMHRLDEVILRLVGFQKSGRRCHLASALEWSKSRLTEKEYFALIEIGCKEWYKYYEIKSQVVVEEILEVLEEIGSLSPTILGVSIPGPLDHVNLVLQELAQQQSWEFYDFRTASTEDVLNMAKGLAFGGVKLVAANPQLKPYPLHIIAETLADNYLTFTIGNQQFGISPKSIIVCVFAASTPIDWNEELMAIFPYMINVDELRQKYW